jgi:hypothetical protein
MHVVIYAIPKNLAAAACNNLLIVYLIGMVRTSKDL